MAFSVLPVGDQPLTGATCRRLRRGGQVAHVAEDLDAEVQAAWDLPGARGASLTVEVS